jgi:S1-C subfamily serine protease
MRSIAIAVVTLAAALAAASAAARPALADDLAEQIRTAYEKAAPSTVVVGFYVQRDDGARADARILGCAVDEKGLVMIPSAAIPAQIALAQFHDFKVIINEGDDLKEYQAEYQGKDEQAQVAFIRVTDEKAPPLVPIVFDTDVRLKVGDPVLSFSMLGEPDGYARAVQLTRVAVRIDQPVTTFLVNGSLGGPGTPVLTLDGRAVGIVGLVQINRATNARPKWSLAEVIWPAERFMERLANPPQGGAVVRRPWLGVETLTPVTKDLAEYFKLGDRRGVVVGQIIAKSPADKAGLKAEDIILAVDGQGLKGTEGQLVENFGNDMRERKVGDALTLTVWRGGEEKSLKITLAEQPKTAAEAERFRDAQFGLTVREMVLADRIERELPADEKGVVVSFIDPAGWAADGGLRGGDIVRKVQDKDTPDLRTFRRIFQETVKDKPKEVVLFVLRGKTETQVVRLEPRWDAEKPAGGQEK